MARSAPPGDASCQPVPEAWRRTAGYRRLPAAELQRSTRRTGGRRDCGNREPDQSAAGTRSDRTHPGGNRRQGAGHAVLDAEDRCRAEGASRRRHGAFGHDDPGSRPEALSGAANQLADPAVASNLEPGTAHQGDGFQHRAGRRGRREAELCRGRRFGQDLCLFSYRRHHGDAEDCPAPTARDALQRHGTVPVPDQCRVGDALPVADVPRHGGLPDVSWRASGLVRTS